MIANTGRLDMLRLVVEKAPGALAAINSIEETDKHDKGKKASDVPWCWVGLG